MTDLVTGVAERGFRIVYGKPEVVEAEIERLKDSYVATGVFFYVVADHPEVAITLVHEREIRKAQLGAMAAPGQRFRQ